MKVTYDLRNFSPVTLNITFETKLELEQLKSILMNDNDRLNNLIPYAECKLHKENDAWLDQLVNTIDDIMQEI